MLNKSFPAKKKNIFVGFFHTEKQAPSSSEEFDA